MPMKTDASALPHDEPDDEWSDNEWFMVNRWRFDVPESDGYEITEEEAEALRMEEELRRHALEQLAGRIGSAVLARDTLWLFEELRVQLKKLFDYLRPIARLRCLHRRAHWWRRHQAQEE